MKRAPISQPKVNLESSELQVSEAETLNDHEELGEVRDGSLFMRMAGSDKKCRAMKYFFPETTGYEYFKKQNDRVLKKVL